VTTTTKTFAETIQTILNEANPNTLADALKKIALGTMMSPVKAVVTGLTAANSFDLTSAAVFAKATVTGLPAGEVPASALPPIRSVTTLRVTAVGTGALGPRVVTDAGGTAGAPGATGPGIALLSDDGKTLTFEGTVTGFTIEYSPRALNDLGTGWAPST
jgi:hypothetical protein